MYRPHRPALTSDRVRHVGQSVALVIAETISQGKDAVEAIEVEFNQLPAHFSTAEANNPDTPRIWVDCENNEAVYVEKGDSDAVDDAITNAHHVVRDRFIVNRVAACTMEPRRRGRHVRRRHEPFSPSMPVTSALISGAP